MTTSTIFIYVVLGLGLLTAAIYYFGDRFPKSPLPLGGKVIDRNRRDYKWLLVVEFPDGHMEDVETKQDTWQRCEIGTRVAVSRQLGRATGIVFYDGVKRGYCAK